MAALGIVVLLLAGLLTLLVIGVEVGPVALATGVVLAVLPVPIYVALALFVDRFEPEPRTCWRGRSSGGPQAPR